MQLGSKTMGEVVGEMGIKGLYKGVGATLARYDYFFFLRPLFQANPN